MFPIISPFPPIIVPCDSSPTGPRDATYQSIWVSVSAMGTMLMRYLSHRYCQPGPLNTGRAGQLTDMNTFSLISRWRQLAGLY